MSRECTICKHPDRKKIEKALVVPNASIRAIASQWNVSRAALSRHVNNGHIAARIEKAASAREAVEAEGFLSHLQRKKSRFARMAEEAQKKNDPHLELKVYQVESKFTEMEGKALGAFKEKVEHTGKNGAPIEHQINVAEEVKKVAHLLPNVKL